LALQQGEIKPTTSPLYNAACTFIRRQIALLRECHGLKLTPHTSEEKNEEEGRKEERDELFVHVSDLVAPTPDFMTVSSHSIALFFTSGNPDLR